VAVLHDIMSVENITILPRKEYKLKLGRQGTFLFSGKGKRPSFTLGAKLLTQETTDVRHAKQKNYLNTGIDC